MDAQVADMAFCREILQISVTTMQLKRVVGDLKAAVGRQPLGHGAQHGGAWITPVQRIGRGADHQPGGFDLAWQAENFDEITEPRMAEGWEVTNGGRAYTFSLRKGWPSHAGNEFTAADVKWAFDRSFALHGITSFYNTLSTIERPEDVKVLDKYTVRIELAEPGPDLLLTLSTFWR